MGNVNDKKFEIIDDDFKEFFVQIFDKVILKNDSVVILFNSLKTNNKNVDEFELVNNDSYWSNISVNGNVIIVVRFYISLRFYYSDTLFSREKFKILCRRFYAESTGYELTNELIEFFIKKIEDSKTRF